MKKIKLGLISLCFLLILTGCGKALGEQVASIEASNQLEQNYTLEITLSDAYEQRVKQELLFYISGNRAFDEAYSKRVEAKIDQMLEGLKHIQITFWTDRVNQCMAINVSSTYQLAQQNKTFECQIKWVDDTIYISRASVVSLLEEYYMFLNDIYGGDNTQLMAQFNERLEEITGNKAYFCYPITEGMNKYALEEYQTFKEELWSSMPVAESLMPQMSLEEVGEGQYCLSGDLETFKAQLGEVMTYLTNHREQIKKQGGVAWLTVFNKVFYNEFISVYVENDLPGVLQNHLKEEKEALSQWLGDEKDLLSYQISYDCQDDFQRNMTVKMYLDQYFNRTVRSDLAHAYWIQVSLNKQAVPKAHTIIAEKNVADLEQVTQNIKNHNCVLVYTERNKAISLQPDRRCEDLECYEKDGKIYLSYQIIWILDEQLSFNDAEGDTMKVYHMETGEETALSLDGNQYIPLDELRKLGYEIKVDKENKCLLIS